MLKFDFFSVARVVFGRGQFSRLGELAAPFGSRALIVFNGDEALAALAGEKLASAKIDSHQFRQRGEPTVEDVDRGLELARSNGVELLIGIGGGSAIDASKAIAGLLTNGGTALDYIEVVGKGQKITRPSLPWIAIPTTAGTGAEVTRNAVIGAPQQRFKASIRGEQLLPRIALVDAELAIAVPPEVTARSGMDALCQLIESYTSTGAQPITDALAMQGITLAARSLRKAYRNGADLDAREDMAMAALLSGITLTNAGLGAVHGFAAPLGANFPAPHGTICAALLPHVMEANVAALRENSADHSVTARYASIGRALQQDANLDERTAIESGIQFTTGLARDLHIPPLSRFGMSEQDVVPMVQLAKKASSMRYNPVSLSDEQLAKVLRNGISGFVGSAF